MKGIQFLIIGLWVISAGAFAQKGVEDGSKYGHGEDSIRCTRNLALFPDASKHGRFEEAYTKWIVVFEECPLAHSSIYSEGARIVKAMYSKEKDAVKKEEYYQLLMRVYDQRIKYFGTHSRYPATYIKGIKAIDMLEAKRDDAEVVKEALALLDEAIGGKLPTIQAAFPLTYMTTTMALYKTGILNAEQVVKNYLKANDITAKLVAASDEKTKASFEQAKNGVEQIFAQSGAADCETIATIFGPKLEENKTNLEWLKLVNYLLAKGSCSESNLFYATSESLHRIEPSASTAYGLAKMYLKQNHIERTMGYYKEAVEMEQDPIQKGKYLLDMGIISMSHNRYADARTYANRAAEVRANWGAPYLLIGKAYASSANSIGTKEIEKKSAYWAAVDKFLKAKSVDVTIAAEANELIGLYSQYFPGSEELFFEGIQDGSVYVVGGWINERTTVRSKR